MNLHNDKACTFILCIDLEKSAESREEFSVIRNSDAYNRVISIKLSRICRAHIYFYKRFSLIIHKHSLLFSPFIHRIIYATFLFIEKYNIK